MFKPNPWLVSPPGSQIADIPIPDETGYAALSPFLHQQGRSIERVLGDGNCLFRSLSHQLTGTQDHHLILRKTITKFEQSYYGMFQQLHNTINRTPFSSHIKTCIWGTTVEILADAGLTLRGRKCSIGMSQVSYLGHIFSASGMGPDPQKVKAIQDWPTPSDVTALRQFLGHSSQYY